MDKRTREEEGNCRPTPDDFDRYLPWACSQLQANAEILVTKVMQSEYVSVGLGDRSKAKSKSKPKTPASKTNLDPNEKEDKSCYRLQTWSNTAKVIRIDAIYDNFNNLVHIKFDGNRQIPQTVMKIVGMIIKFQVCLTGITINQGCSASVIYELCKSQSFSNITDICLDNTFISEANYHILLEDHNNIRQISLARCKLEDAVVEKIVSKLVYPLPASKTLSILNVSSNRITDEGCKHLSEALRSNRQLSYSNLADNAITDVGAESLLNSLQKFPMRCNEIMAGRSRLMVYLKAKNDLINRMIVELKSGDSDRRSAKKKSLRSASLTPQKKGKMEKESSLKAITDKSLVNLDAIYFEKAITMAENILGDYQDPFSSYDTSTIDDIVYALGNNTLCYLNLAYNNLSYIILNKLLDVVHCQKYLDRRPRGLINVCIEGNQIPYTCLELKQLDEILEIGLMVHNRRLSAIGKKRPASKSGK